MDVQCLSICLVKPSVPTQKHRMFLSAIDRKCLLFEYIQTILFYKYDDESHFHSMVAKLNTSLSLALVDFYPLAGSLVMGENGRHEIECNDSGVELVEASANVRFPDLDLDPDFEPLTSFPKLIHMAVHQRSDSSDLPLLSVQVTRFVGGGVTVGLSCSHVVADGHSFWHFMKSWAEVSRGLAISMPPIHDRTLLKATQAMDATVDPLPNPQEREVAEKAVKISEKGDLAVKSSEKEDLNKVKASDDADLCYKTFYFSHEMLQSLKQEAMEGGKGPFSSFVAFCSHFWRCMVKSRGVAEEEMMLLIVPVDVRRKLNPPLSPSFFGNCFDSVITGTRAEKLFSDGMWYGAEIIAQGINSMTDRGIREKIQNLEGMGRTIDIKKNVSGGYHVNVVQSPRFPVYEIDFGWGIPGNARPPAIKDGAIVTLGGRDGGSDIEASVTLSRRQMKLLESIIFSFPVHGDYRSVVLPAH
eukprot:Gb_13282 [translate_table: standard]